MNEAKKARKGMGSRSRKISSINTGVDLKKGRTNVLLKYETLSLSLL